MRAADDDGRQARPSPGLRALLIAGPTASGKSAAALELARLFDATIVNADSMQVYRDLRLLTARPTARDEAWAPHALFGVIDGAVNYSVGQWLVEASRIAERAFAEGRPVIFVGGSGLYFRALTEGLADAPAVPPAVRAAVREGAQGRPTTALHEALKAVDPATAARLQPNDRQRVLRALEIFEASGASLAAVQAADVTPFLKRGEWAGLFLAPERAELDERINARFDAMLAAGALEEAAALAARRLAPDLPVMRALGAPQLLAHLAGEATLEEAALRAKLETRRYSKRQFTWARHHMPAFRWVKPAEAVAIAATAFERLAGD
ncbi:MAG TPA: tRNA (adenosine(37)-N6)-dimethylallyltransferase MiaA [Roseiarcus sp.]|nr:tRNA (adenosine(37)-N6)-dimethylallyltransferase MiaA [Roseiarcus sp.]